VCCVLGRGVCFDDCEEITGADEETLRVWFHRFCKKFAAEMYPIYVKPPQSTATIAAAERLYAALGLPGAISSTDCTHAQWDMCPACKSFLWQKSEFPAAVLMDALLCCTAELVAHKGPKGKPTRVFQMTVGHNHIIYYVSRTFPGTYADKSIVRYDQFLQQVRRDPLYTQFPFKVTTSLGSREMRGVYSLSDCGFHPWRTLQFPVKRPWSMEALLWSARVSEKGATFATCASVEPDYKRECTCVQDVECAFGRLKGRFRILKLPLRFHKIEV